MEEKMDWSTVIKYVMEFLKFLWQKKWYIILLIALSFLLIMNKCERDKTADALKKVETLEQQVLSQNKEISDLKIAVQVAQKEAEMKTAELKIVKEAMTTQKQLTEKEKAEMEKKKDELLNKYSNETDLKKKAEIEAEYWSSIYGIQARVETKGCPAGQQYCVKAVSIKPIVPVKSTTFGRR